MAKSHEEVEELWVVLEDYPDYAVSNYGSVLLLSEDKDEGPYVDPKGYHVVTLWGDRGLLHHVYVQDLVAKAFFLNYVDGMEVLHINGNKGDNTVLNLTLGIGGEHGQS